MTLRTQCLLLFLNTFSSTETESATNIKTDMNISFFLILSFQLEYYISKVKILLSIIKRGRYKKLFLHNVRMCYFEIKAKRTLSDTSFSNAQNGTYLFFETGNEKWKNEMRLKNKTEFLRRT